MIGFNALANIGKKVASYAKLTSTSACQANPIKLGLNGKNLAALEKDTITISKNVEIAKIKFNSQAERLKAFYESKGYPYLLPHQEWSDKKILDTAKAFGKKLDDMVESKTLNKKTLQETLENLAPEIKGKIEIKDAHDLKKMLLNNGMHEKQVEILLKKAGGLTEHDAKTCTVYLNFGKLSEGQEGQTIFKSFAEHEVKHALTQRLQNTTMTDMFKNESYKCDEQHAAINKIFEKFGDIYNKISGKQEQEITQKRLVKSLGFNSVNDMHNNFEKTLNKLIENADDTGNLYMDSSKKGWKQFYNSLKNSAKDEKEAYQSGTRFRENFKDPNTPTDYELRPLLYAEMEKFFAKKRIQVNKQIPNA